MDEPSVLDYVKSKLMPWRGNAVVIPAEEAPLPQESPSPDAKPEKNRKRVPWLILLVLLHALAAQSVLEPPDPKPIAAGVLYGLAAAALFFAIREYAEITQPVRRETVDALPVGVHEAKLAIGGVFLILAFALFGNNRFTMLNVTAWLVGIGFIVSGLWVRDEKAVPLAVRLKKWLLTPVFHPAISRWSLLVLAVMGLAIFFRFYRLGEVPVEMFSDQAEKLWDVQDVLSGKTPIFFTRNTGREAFQFYLTAAIIKLFGTGISFLSLKLGTAFAGVFALPYIYLLGKEISGKWVGLIALLLTGVAYWANVISRIGLRFPFYPMFTAPALYYLIRGLRRSNRNDFVLAGLWLGIGLHGYSPARMLPLVIVAGVAIYLLHRQAAGRRAQVLLALLLLAFVAFVVFLPLFRYTLENPDAVGSRALSRLSDTERALPGSAVDIFLRNLWAALIMFFWNNGDIWVHSIPNRPALDVVSAALFFIGLVVVGGRYARHRNWVDLFLLAAVPLLMMPSIMSLAFPEENPSLNRTGGAIVPVFIIAATGFVALLGTLKERLGGGKGVAAAVILGGALLGGAISQNYNLVFHTFDDSFASGAWNTSEIGGVIRGFADSVGTPDTAYVVPYPHWVDTRLVGINAGFPKKDYALWHENFEDTLPDPRAKLFIFKPEDTVTQEKLAELYPGGMLTRHITAREGKDFMMYLVPGAIGSQQ